jgi:hypothetical protein
MLNGARLHSSCIELHDYLVKWKVIHGDENVKMVYQTRVRLRDEIFSSGMLKEQAASKIGFGICAAIASCII